MPSESVTDAADADRRIAALEAVQLGDPAVAYQLAVWLTVRFVQFGGGVDDRDRAIELFRDTVAISPTNEANAALGVLLVLRALPAPLGADPGGAALMAFTQSMMDGGGSDPARLADRAEAAEVLARVVASEPAGSPLLSHASGLLAVLRLLDGDLQAFPLLMQAAQSAPPEQAAWLDALTCTIQPEADPDRFVTGMLRAVEQLPADHQLRRLILAEVGAWLAAQGHVASLPAHLSAAVGELAATVDAMSAGDPVREATVRQLAGFLLTAAAYSGGPDDVARVVRLAEELVAANDPVMAGKDRFLRAMALTLRGRMNGDSADLAAAASDLTAALDTVPVEDPLTPAIAGMLGALLSDRHLVRGVLADSDASRAYLRHAREVLDRYDSASTDGDVIALIAVMPRIAVAMLTRDTDELDRCIPELRAGLERLPDGYPWRSRLDATLGLAHLVRGTVRRDPGEILAGIERIDTAGGTLAVEESGRPALLALGALGMLLRGLLDGDPAAYRAAADRLATAVESGPLPAGDRIALATLQAQVAAVRAEFENSPDELDRAITGLEEVGALTAGHPLAMHVAVQLAEAYRTRDASAADRQNSVTAGLAALRALGTDVLLQSGTAYALTAARGSTLARRVADWCLTDGRPDQAVEALELGRGLVLHAATATVTIPELLRGAGHPDLACEWESASPEPESWLPPDQESALAVLHQLGGVPSDLRPRVLDALAGTRALEQLLATPAPEQIAAAVRTVDADALVYVLPGDDGGLLLLVDASGTLHQLPAPSLRNATAPALDRRPGIAVRDVNVGAVSRFDEVCEWAWPAFVEPLLAHLGDTDAEHPHRLVLVPADVLGYVPWAAARTTCEERIRYAVEPLSISYSASARQLITVAGRAGVSDGAVLVANPTGDLPGATAEVEALKAHIYPDAVVLGQAANATGAGTPEQVGARATGAALLHLACHATAAPRPGDSRLKLDGGDLSVAGILGAAEGAPGGLVVLSACTSDLTNTAPDEALTLATAFLAAGAISVVGSRWAVDDRMTAQLMVMFHHFRTAGGLGDRDALRAAQRWLIDPDRQFPTAMEGLATSDRLTDHAVWAAFAHHGR